MEILKGKVKVLGKSFYSLSFNFQKVSNSTQFHTNNHTCRVVGATYANGWLIIVGASKTSPVPGSVIRRRHAHRRILPSLGALRADNTPNAALRGLRMISR